MNKAKNQIGKLLVRNLTLRGECFYREMRKKGLSRTQALRSLYESDKSAHDAVDRSFARFLASGFKTVYTK